MTVRDAVILATFMLVPFVGLYGLSRFSRWYLGRTDNIDELIAKNAFRWRKDGDGFMDTCDHQKLSRAGELRWQEILRAQRRTRKRPDPEKIMPSSKVIHLQERRRRRG